MKTATLLLCLGLQSMSVAACSHVRAPEPQTKPPSQSDTSGDSQNAAPDDGNPADEVCPELGDGVNSFPHRDKRNTP